MHVNFLSNRMTKAALNFSGLEIQVHLRIVISQCCKNLQYTDKTNRAVNLYAVKFSVQTT